MMRLFFSLWQRYNTPREFNVQGFQGLFIKESIPCTYPNNTNNKYLFKIMFIVIIFWFINQNIQTVLIYGPTSFIQLSFQCVLLLTGWVGFFQVVFSPNLPADPPVESWQNSNKPSNTGQSSPTLTVNC